MLRNVSLQHAQLRFRVCLTILAINRFKDFLSAISREDSLAGKAEKLKILRQYCNAQRASSGEYTDFPDLISTWSLAVQSNNDSICSAVPAALSQFYKTISEILEFREFGLSLAHTLLKREQVRLFDHGLSAPKTRDHLISPCLRLLTEIVAFDGGALASRVFDRRDFLFKRLDSLLEQQINTVSSDRRKPSVRRMALRLMIANLRFLESDARNEFVTHGRILRSCLRGLPNDGDDIVVDVLRAFEFGVVDDKETPRVIRNRIFTQDVLALLAALYDYELDPDHPETSPRVRTTVHDILLKICTTKRGLVVPQNGWYPTGFENMSMLAADADFIDLGLDSPAVPDDYGKALPVKNATLLAFTSVLKPESDTLQSALLLQVFRSAPELVAAYFSHKPKFTISSSEDSAWRGQFAFLFSVVQLPNPHNFGWQDGVPVNPPPVSTIVESIVPRPIDRANFSHLFTSEDEILILSGSKLLLTVLEKTNQILKLFDAHRDSNTWQQGSTQLLRALTQRVPKLSELINSLQRNGTGNEALRLALIECVAAYHRILPEAIAGSKFDFGTALLDTISQMEDQSLSPETNAILGEQAVHLSIIAQLSPTTKWWSKSNSDTLSLFARVLRYIMAGAEGEDFQTVKAVLRSVVSATGILGSSSRSFEALTRSLTHSTRFELTDNIWLLLDSAIYHTVQRPVKYLDRVEAIQKAVSNESTDCLLAVAVAEQWEYAVKNHTDSKTVLRNVAEWIVCFFGALEVAGENNQVLQQLLDGMLQISEARSKDILQRAIESARKKATAVGLSLEDTPGNVSEVPTQSQSRVLNLDDLLGTATASKDTLDKLDHWDDKTDIELAVQSGRLAKLVRCTASLEEEIRRQAFHSLQKLTHIVDRSTYEEKVQLHLLIGEITQTVRHHGFDSQLPSAAAELGARLLEVISNPAHGLYGKANTFLLKGPAWELRRLISYWGKSILFREPDSEDAGSWTNEIEWLLQWLAAGLQTKSDMEFYRRSGILEKILALYSKPGLSRSVRRLILTLIWRSVCADGADTLITRAGIQNWLQVAKLMDRDHTHIIQQLETEVEGACTQSVIQKWKENRPILRE